MGLFNLFFFAAAAHTNFHCDRKKKSFDNFLKNNGHDQVHGHIDLVSKSSSQLSQGMNSRAKKYDQSPKFITNSKLLEIFRNKGILNYNA